MPAVAFKPAWRALYRERIYSPPQGFKIALKLNLFYHFNMSSFIIDKKEYIKAAGLMYGLEMRKKCPHSWFLKNVREKFCEIYYLNCASVAEQYKESPDNAVWDGFEYDSTFQTYIEIGRNLSESDMPTVKNGLQMFFESILYQIENKGMHEEASDFLYMCSRKLNELPNIDGWWGEVSI